MEKNNENTDNQSVSKAVAHEMENAETLYASEYMDPPPLFAMADPKHSSEPIAKEEQEGGESETISQVDDVKSPEIDNAQKSNDLSSNQPTASIKEEEKEEEVKDSFALDLVFADEAPETPNDEGEDESGAAGDDGSADNGDENPVQKKETNGSSAADSPSENGVPSEVMSKMENSFGTNFSNVKINTNSNKAKDAGALAYTQGNSIDFAPGQFKPNTNEGQNLLGHELTHVVQQRQGRVKPTTSVNGMSVNDDKGLENEADVMGAKAASSTSVLQKKEANTKRSSNTTSQMKVGPYKEGYKFNNDASQPVQGFFPLILAGAAVLGFGLGLGAGAAEFSTTAAHRNRNSQNRFPTGTLSRKSNGAVGDYTYIEGEDNIFLDDDGTEWRLLPDSKNVFHQPDDAAPGTAPNKKFLAFDGEYGSVEAILQPGGDGSYSTNWLNEGDKQGTYNYYDPDTAPIRHGLYDVLPHMMPGGGNYSNTPTTQQKSKKNSSSQSFSPAQFKQVAQLASGGSESALRERAIQLAKGEIGKVQSMIDDGSGNKVGHERLQEYFKITAPDVWDDEVITKVQHQYPAFPHWCGIFAIWAIKKAGRDVGNWVPGRGVIDSGVLGSTDNPQPGDIGYMQAKSHHSLIIEVNGDSIVSVDGNTNLGEVKQVTRTKDQYQGFFTAWGGDAVQLKKEQSSSDSSQLKTDSGHVMQKMEDSFGTSFSDVNIHENSSSATDAGALAYAQGSDVHFAPGQFKLNTQGGQELLGHELTHVVQQREGRVRPTTQMKGMDVNDDPKLENEADEMGRKAASGVVQNKKSGISNSQAFSPIQRQDDGKKTGTIKSFIFNPYDYTSDKFGPAIIEKFINTFINDRGEGMVFELTASGLAFFPLGPVPAYLKAGLSLSFGMDFMQDFTFLVGANISTFGGVGVGKGKSSNGSQSKGGGGLFASVGYTYQWEYSGVKAVAGSIYNHFVRLNQKISESGLSHKAIAQLLIPVIDDDFIKVGAKKELEVIEREGGGEAFGSVKKGSNDEEKSLEGKIKIGARTADVTHKDHQDPDGDGTERTSTESTYFASFEGGFDFDGYGAGLAVDFSRTSVVGDPNVSMNGDYQDLGYTISFTMPAETIHKFFGKWAPKSNPLLDKTLSIINSLQGFADTRISSVVASIKSLSQQQEVRNIGDKVIEVLKMDKDSKSSTYTIGIPFSFKWQLQEDQGVDSYELLKKSISLVVSKNMGVGNDNLNLEAGGSIKLKITGDIGSDSLFFIKQTYIDAPEDPEKKGSKPQWDKFKKGNKGAIADAVFNCVYNDGAGPRSVSSAGDSPAYISLFNKIKGAAGDKQEYCKRNSTEMINLLEKCFKEDITERDKVGKQVRDFVSLLSDIKNDFFTDKRKLEKVVDMLRHQASNGGTENVQSFIQMAASYGIDPLEIILIMGGYWSPIAESFFDKHDIPYKIFHKKSTETKQQQYKRNVELAVQYLDGGNYLKLADMFRYLSSDRDLINDLSTTQGKFLLEEEGYPYSFLNGVMYFIFCLDKGTSYTIDTFMQKWDSNSQRGYTGTALIILQAGYKLKGGEISDDKDQVNENTFNWYTDRAKEGNAVLIDESDDIFQNLSYREISLIYDLFIYGKKDWALFNALAKKSKEDNTVSKRPVIWLFNLVFKGITAENLKIFLNKISPGAGLYIGPLLRQSGIDTNKTAPQLIGPSKADSEEKSAAPVQPKLKNEVDPSSVSTGDNSSSEHVKSPLQLKENNIIPSGVNIHKESASATKMGALAYAQGSDIHFAPGQFKLDTRQGQELIGHELGHVVQQKEGRVKTTTQLKGADVNDDLGLEKEADDFGVKFADSLQSESTSPVQNKVENGFSLGSSTLQKKENPNINAPMQLKEAAAGGAGEGGGTSEGSGPISIDGSQTVTKDLLSSQPLPLFGKIKLAPASLNAALTTETSELKTSFPNIEQPTGIENQPLPEGGETVQAPHHLGYAGQGGAGEVTVPATTPAVNKGPNADLAPASQASAMPPSPVPTAAVAGPPSTNVSIGEENIDYSAGPRPAVDTSGDANPAKMTTKETQDTAKVESDKTLADLAIDKDHGEEDIFPHYTELENLTPDVEIPQGQEIAVPLFEELTEKSAEIDAGFNAQAQSKLDGDMAQHVASNEAEVQKMNQGSEEEWTTYETDKTEEEARVKTEQETAQKTAKTEVTTQQENWKTENEDVKKQFVKDAGTAKTSYQGQIDSEITTADSDVKNTFNQAEIDASKEAEDAQRQADEKQTESDNDDGGFNPFGWAADKISKGLGWLQDQFNSIVNWLKEAVDAIIEAAKSLANTIIEAARSAITGLIKAFGELLKAFVDIAFAAFPEIRDRIKDVIDTAVDAAVEVVNTLADALKDFVNALLDALGAALNFLLDAYQKFINILFAAIELLTVGLYKIYKGLTNLALSVKQSPGHFMGQLQEEFLGMNLSDKLPFERDTHPDPSTFRPPVAGENIPSIGGMPPVLDKDPLSESDFEVAVINEPAGPELSEDLISSIPDGAEKEFGGSDVDELDLLRQAYLGSETSEGQIPQEGEPMSEADAYPYSHLADDPNARADAELDTFLGNQPAPDGASASKDSGGEKAEPSAIEESAKIGPFTAGQRFRYLRTQMWNGIKGWYEANKVAIITGIVAAVVVGIALVIASGGTVLSLVGPLMTILGAFFLGEALVRAGIYIKNFLSKAWGGGAGLADGAKDFARAMVIMIVELIFILLFDLDKILKAARDGLKSTLRTAVGSAADAGKKFTNVGRTTYRNTTDAFSSLGRGVRGTLNMASDGTRITVTGLKSGFSTGVKKVSDLIERLKGLKFKKFKIVRSGKWFKLYGKLNPWVLLASGQIVEVENKGGVKVGQEGDFVVRTADDVLAQGDEVSGILIGGRTKPSSFVDNLARSTDEVAAAEYQGLLKQIKSSSDATANVRGSGLYRNPNFRSNFFKSDPDASKLSINARRFLSVHHVVPNSARKIPGLSDLMTSLGRSIDEVDNAMGLPRVDINQLEELLGVIKQGSGDPARLKAIIDEFSLPNLSNTELEKIIDELAQFKNRTIHSDYHTAYTRRVTEQMQLFVNRYDELLETGMSEAQAIASVQKQFDQYMDGINAQLLDGTSNIFQ